MAREPITDLSVYKDKPATPMQESFADWIVDEVGIVYGTQKELDAFRNGVRLAKALIMRYQASDASKEASAEIKAERDAARAQREQERAAAAAEATEAEAAPAAPAKAAPAAKATKATKAAAAKAAPPAETAKPPATRGRRGAAAPKVDAPF